MRFGGAISSQRVRWAGVAAVLGGVLWEPYGVFEMLEPWGPDVVYRDELGYAQVIDTVRFIAYSLPGSLALLLTSLGLLGILALLQLPARRGGRSVRFLAYAALGLAMLSTAGVIAQVDPLFTGGRIFGSLALGAATFLAAVDVRRDGDAPGWTLTLLVLGLIGLLLLPLWPLVYALQWVPRGGGAVIIALYGLGWVAAGSSLWSTMRA